MHSFHLLLLTFATQLCVAMNVPANIQNFYNNIKNAGSCSNILQTAFSYCGDHLDDYGVIYLQGTDGALADMDIDCDGLQNGPGDDGRCGSSTDTQSQSSFEDIISGYGQGVGELNAFVHPYVVFGNEGSSGGYQNFNPQDYGVKPLSLMAVVCGGQMFYGIWGDENGDDGPKAMVGEASISMATLCFGDSVNGNSGHADTDVLYIAFTGSDAVPGTSAKWDADSVGEFEGSIQALGDNLIQRIGGGGSTSPASSSPSASCPPCSWDGHCAGASCDTADDCDGSLTCIDGQCGGEKVLRDEEQITYRSKSENVGQAYFIENVGLSPRKRQENIAKVGPGKPAGDEATDEPLDD
ncbi:Chitosanase-domain-containing protein [Mollisia scopiformis]|uniref:Endo-chitosanase n=1 Tax=Mollisia scopiformis TaxID=149040 RepID=A0A194XHJ8_MOLSC|nr:Chitosanase-domain-containing protein [Mollisia scopiformis]KUJ19604.1 Chitosanase-domain-containing protein [Mollisia scopiformis]